jgi:hypothetical protein
MSFFDKLRAMLDRYEAKALEPAELTALLPLRTETSASREQLLALLRTIDAAQPSPFTAATSVHQARFIVVERAKLSANEAAPDFPFGPLVFSFVHDGDVEDALHELFERCGETLDSVFTHCPDYPGANDRAGCVRQLLAARVPSRFAYSDGGASRTEILRALELRRRFVDFVIHQQRASDHDLWRAFDRFRGGRWPESPSKPKAGARARARASARPSSNVPANDTLGARLDYGLPLLRPFERPLPAEQYWVRRLAELARARSRRDARAQRARTDDSLLLRATFVVRPDLPAELQHGVFVPGGRYAAWLRVCRSGEAESGDELGIKLERVGALGNLLDLGLPEANPAGCQDFVLCSHPTFFAKDVRDYTVLRSILHTRDERARARRLTVFALRRPRESWSLARRWLRARKHRPLEREYHSATAYALGPQLAVKYCLAPVSPLKAAEPIEDIRPEDETLQQRLDPSHGEALALSFYAVVPSRDTLPVEDPRFDWEAAGAQRVLVASIEIERQDLQSAERGRVAETLVFTPWHTLEAHRPLGGINRARLELDRASAEGVAAESGDSARHGHVQPPMLERRSRPPSVRATAERWSSAPHVRPRSSAPPGERVRAPKSVRAPSRRKRNRSVH